MERIRWRKIVTREEKSIFALLADYEESLNASDAEGIAALYSDDGIFVPPGFPTAGGRDAVLRSYRAIFGDISVAIDFGPSVPTGDLELGKRVARARWRRQV